MKYWAFISYSHTDKRWGDWLHKALETYRVPKRLVGRESRDGELPRRLFPIFRDREELPVSADLGSNISEALRESRYLIVICSPRAAQSHWVDEEIKVFKKLGREDRILALIVGGEPNAAEGKAGIAPEEECFPKSMRYRLGPDGEFSSERTEPIAADAREGKDGKENAKLKLLAGLLGINYDELRQRDRERRRRRAWLAGSIAVVLLATFGALAAWATISAKHVRQQKVASDVARANELFDQNNAAGAILHLARATELDRGERSVAADRLWFALTERSWPLPLSPSMQHKDGILSACFSHDGKKILTASRDKTARLWDANSGRQLGEPLLHPRLVRRAMFTPNGQFVVTIGFDGIARLWDAASGHAIPQWRIQHNDSINSVAISPDGKWIATGSADGSLRISELPTGKNMIEMLQAENVHTLAFDPVDPNVLLGVSGDTVTVWNWPDGRRLFDLAHDEQINSAEFSPDGKRIVSASDDRSCQLWTSEKTGQPIGEKLNHNAEVRSASFSSDGELIASLAGEQLIIWSTKEKVLRKYTLTHRRRVSCACFAPDNLVVFSGTEEGVVQGWDLRNGKSLGEPIREEGGIVSISMDDPGKKLLVTTTAASVRAWRPPARNPLATHFAHKAGIQSMHMSGDGKTLLTTSDDDTARLWNLEDIKQPPKSLAHKAAVLCGALTRNAQHAITGSADRTARLWQTASGQPASEPLDQTAAVSQVAFSRDDTLFATATEGGLAQFWEFSSRRAVGKTMNHNTRISRIEFSRDGRLFLTAGSNTKVELWVSRTGEPAGIPLRTAKEITSAHFSPSRDIIAAGDGDGVLHLWSTLTLKPLKQFTVGSVGVSAFEFSPDGQLVAATSGDTATMWSVSSGQQIGELLRHTSPVTAIRFGADSKRVATGTDDGAVRLWDASTGLALSEKLLHEKGIRDLVFSPDGKILFGSSRDRAIKAWDVSAGVTSAGHQALAELARAISPLRLSDAGQLEPREVEPVEILRSHLKDFSGPARICAEWMISDPTERTLTPYSRQSLSGYVETLVQENDNDSRREAAFLASGDEKMLRAIVPKTESGNR